MELSVSEIVERKRAEARQRLQERQNVRGSPMKQTTLSFSPVAVAQANPSVVLPKPSIPISSFDFVPKKTVPPVSSTASTSPFFPPPSSNSPKGTFAKPIVNKTRQLEVYFELMDTQHYSVKCKSDKDVNAVFRSLPGHQYDHTTFIWIFPKDTYCEMLQKLNKIQDLQLHIIPIPETVLNLFGFPSTKFAKPQITMDQFTCSPPDLKLSMVSPMLKRLLPFQEQGVRCAVERKGRILIADEMGLGKTIQAICVACFYALEWPLLVVCPSSLRLTWLEQLIEWASPAFVQPHQIQVLKNAKEAIRGKVVIVSYDMAVRANLAAASFKVIIADESHFLKNQKTKRSEVLLPILQGATRCILLSGTPALSRPIELFTQIQAVNKNIFPVLHHYAVRYCAAVKNHFGWDYKGSSNLQELQTVLEKAIFIRRMKSQVLTQLPPKQRQQVFLSISSKAAKKLEAISSGLPSEATTEFGELPPMKRSMIMEFWKESAAAKLPAMLEYVEDLLESGRKFLLFAHHHNVLDAFADMFDSKKIGYIRIDGQTPSSSRQDLCFQFQNDEECQVALLGINAAGVGLTLHAASLVVFAELYWNPGVLLQAEDRVHRMGQRDSVSIHYLLAKNTYDDRLWQTLRSKLNTLEKVGLSKRGELNINTEVNRDDPLQSRLDKGWFVTKEEEEDEVEEMTEPTIKQETKMILSTPFVEEEQKEEEEEEEEEDNDDDFKIVARKPSKRILAVEPSRPLAATTVTAPVELIDSSPEEDLDLDIPLPPSKKRKQWLL